jgi:uncharacterized protein (TIGR03437 family)
VTPGVFRATAGWCGGFLAKLNPSGTKLLFSTDVGGDQIAVGKAGDVYLAGSIGDRFSGLSNFPTTPGAFRSDCRRGDYLDTSDAFLAQINPTFSSLTYATCFPARITGLAVDAQGNAYISGTTISSDFITTPRTLGPTGNKDCDADLYGNSWTGERGGDCEIFVTKLDSTGSSLLYSTYVAAADPINGYSRIVIDAVGTVYIAGNTYRPDQFPVLPGSLAGRLGFLMKVNADASAVIASTSLAFSPWSLTVDELGVAYLAGSTTQEPAVSTTPGVFQGSFGGGTFDGAVMKVRLEESAVLPALEARGVVSAASFLPGPIAPGELVTIHGAGFGPKSLTPLEVTPNRRASSLLAWTRVLFDGIPAPMVWVAENQLTAIVPYEVAARGSSEVQIEYLGNRSAPVKLTVAQSAPAIFTADSSGVGQGVAINTSSTSGRLEINSASSPAAIGSIVTVYATGAGQTNPTGIDGDFPGNPPPIAILPALATIGGMQAQVLSVTAVPNVVSGVVQVNLRIPDSVSSGAAVPLTIALGGVSSQPGVTLAIK